MPDGGSTDGQSLSSEDLATMSAVPNPGAGMLGVGAHMASNMERLQHDMDKVKRVAEGKGFAVDENTGDAIIKAVDDYLDKWFKNKVRFEDIERRLQFGSDQYAKEGVATFHGNKASDAAGKLDLLESTLTSLKGAIRTAKKNYVEMEDQATQQFASGDA